MTARSEEPSERSAATSGRTRTGVLDLPLLFSVAFCAVLAGTFAAVLHTVDRFDPIATIFFANSIGILAAALAAVVLRAGRDIVRAEIVERVGSLALPPTDWRLTAVLREELRDPTLNLLYRVQDGDGLVAGEGLRN